MSFVRAFQVVSEEKSINIQICEKRSRWQNRKTWSSPAPTNTSKIHLHVESFLQNNY